MSDFLEISMMEPNARDATLPAGAPLRFESMRRYYLISCCCDLLGDWVISRYWGDKHSRRGGERHERVTSEASVALRLDQLTRQRLRRGYVLVTN